MSCSFQRSIIIGLSKPKLKEQEKNILKYQGSFLLGPFSTFFLGELYWLSACSPVSRRRRRKRKAPGEIERDATHQQQLWAMGEKICRRNISIMGRCGNPLVPQK